MTHEAWMPVLRESIRRWTRAASAASTFFEQGGVVPADGAKSLVDAEREAAEEHWKVIAGDADTCARIERELRDKTK